MLTSEKARQLVEKYGTQQEASRRTGWSVHQIRRALTRGRKDDPVTPEERDRIEEWIKTHPYMPPGEIAHRMNTSFRAVHIEKVKMELNDRTPPALPGLEYTEGRDEDEEDPELVDESIKQAKRAQKFQDLNRVERKSWRERTRVENALREYSSELCRLLDKTSFHITAREHTACSDSTGILQLSDLHLNELIRINGNRADFTVACRRMKLLADEAKRYFNAFEINDIAVCITGDILNSDRRLDELLAQACNRSKATFLAADILSQFLQDLNQDFNITVACVTGNESRLTQEMGFNDELVTDNYDFTVFNLLKYIYRDCEGIDFAEGDPYEKVLRMNGKNILITHGYAVKEKCEQTVAQIKGRYAAKGLLVDYVLFGHLHSSRIGDTYARSASLCGANAYSERALNLTSRASQNIFIIKADGNLDGVKIDLQEVGSIEGYDIAEELESYEAKSASKVRSPATVIISENIC